MKKTMMVILVVLPFLFRETQYGAVQFHLLFSSTDFFSDDPQQDLQMFGSCWDFCQQSVCTVSVYICLYMFTSVYISLYQLIKWSLHLMIGPPISMYKNSRPSSQWCDPRGSQSRAEVALTWMAGKPLRPQAPRRR